MSDPGQLRRPRWWPAVAIVAAGVAAMIVNRGYSHVSRQHQVYAGGAIVLATGFALVLWLVFLSRLRWRTRLVSLAGVVVLLGIGAAAVRIRGVSGDLLPVLEWRWQNRRPDELDVGGFARAGDPAPEGAGAWPQFLGPRRDTVAAEVAFGDDWGAAPPVERWRRKVGTAWSGFAVAGGVAITQEQRGPEEVTVAYALADGRPLWSHAVSARYFTTLAGEGPRATPTIEGDRVFAQGATGVLTCHELTTGRVLWTKDILAENGGSVPDWGVSSSPLVVGEQVVVAPGGGERSLAACRRTDGSPIWSAGAGGGTYSSPVLARFFDEEQIVLFGSRDVAGHDPRDGRKLWSFQWPRGHPHVAVPVFIGDSDLVISSGYGTGAARVRLARDAAGAWIAEEVWRTNRLRAKFANFTLIDGHLYGLDDGTMVCLDAATGERMWKEGDYGHGQQILAGRRLVVMAEDGHIVLIDPDPASLRELGRFRVFNGKTWNPPALAGRWLIVRNDLEACCLELPAP